VSLRRIKLKQRAVSEAEQVQKTIEAVVKDFGRLDVFVANAG
jgi:NAD(P)-dependent dehydrogenase (short-subunit alcohol dehydrogenase family)